MYLELKRGDVSKYVLLTGNPARAKLAASMLSNNEKVSENREFLVFRGYYGDLEVTVCSAGMGAPSTAVAIEELVRAGCKVLIRAGTMIGVNAGLGEIIISTGAVRKEGTSPTYVELGYPAVPDFLILESLVRSAEKAGVKFKVGISSSFDGFYSEMRNKQVLKCLREVGVLGCDMETSLVLTLCNILRVRGGSACLVTVDSLGRCLDSEERSKLEKSLVKLVLDAFTFINKETGGMP